MIVLIINQRAKPTMGDTIARQVALGRVGTLAYRELARQQ